MFCLLLDRTTEQDLWSLQNSVNSFPHMVDICIILYPSVQGDKLRHTFSRTVFISFKKRCHNPELPSIQPRDSRPLLNRIVPHSQASLAPRSVRNLAHLIQFSSSTCQKQTDRKCLCQMRGRVSEKQESLSDLCRPKTGRVSSQRIC